MLSKIVIRNFQSHRKAEFDLEDITTFIGDSDKGKTSILRAIRWVVFARPSGTRFITHGKNKCRVELWFDDGYNDPTIVVRERGRKSPGVYKLICPGQRTKVFKATGTTVPEEIQYVMGLYGINFQAQHDQSFWMFDTPGVVAKNLNKIVNLEAIDKALQLAKSKVKTAKVKVDYSKERINTLRTKVKELSWIKECSADYVELEEVRDQLAKAQDRAKELNLYLSRGRTLLKQRRRLQGRLERANAILRAVQEHRKATAKLRERIEELNARRTKLRLLAGEIHKHHRALDRLGDDLLIAIKKIKGVKSCPLCQQPLPSSQLSSATCT